jgi:3-oxoacyl-[acyl-carrier protein] reductase
VKPPGSSPPAPRKAAIHWKACDVSDVEEVDRFVQWLIDDLSPVFDVLVNNAGGTGSVEPEATTSEAAAYAQHILSANLIGVYLMVHALRPHVPGPGGRIVNISSIAAFRGGGTCTRRPRRVWSD